MIWIFLLGAMFGVCIGMLMTCLCVVSKMADGDKHE